MINAGEGCGEKGTLLHCWWECKLVQPLWRTVMRVPLIEGEKNPLKIELLYDLIIPALGIFLQNRRKFFFM